MNLFGKKNKKIFSSIKENFDYLRSFYGNGIDLVENVNTFSEKQLPIGITYIESITDSMLIRDNILYPILNIKGRLSNNPNDIMMYLKSNIISVPSTLLESDMDKITELIMTGSTVIFLNKAKTALVINSRKVERKGVEAPENESTVLGSQESFTDDIHINTSLLLKRLPIPGLNAAEFTIGSLSRTKVKLMWIKGIANQNAVDEASRRISQVDYDNIGGIGVLAELIEDKPTSIFPKYRQTERPDVAARALADGRFVVLCDGSPFGLVAPFMFWDTFKTSDDYEDRPAVSSYLRIMRYLAFVISTLISPIYLSFVTYNQPIIPTSLALNIAAGREGVPFPTVFEMLLLSMAITIIREAGLRMTKSVGYFVGTLAAIIIGTAVVSAGYVSASLIIVIAISTISSFAISTTTLLYPARLLNYFFILLAGFFGVFGIINGLVLMFWRLASLNSFGVPYLYPVIPFDRQGFKDVLIRSSFMKMKKRMKRLAPENTARTGIEDNKQTVWDILKRIIKF